jgi:metal-responsive CopG/Arc/MetJ family transcriptional regulator
MTLWKNVRDIHLMIPEELLAEIDAAALEQYMSRSEFMRRTLHEAVGGKFPNAIRQESAVEPTRFLDTSDS